MKKIVSIQMLFILFLTVLMSCTQNEYTDIIFQNTFTVEFDANGGSGTMKPQNFAVNEKKALYKNSFISPNPKELFFSGWAQTKNGNVVYKDCQNTEISKNQTLYAVWEYKYDGNSPKAQALEKFFTDYLDETMVKDGTVGDDFYGYVNNLWLKDSDIPETRIEQLTENSKDIEIEISKTFPDMEMISDDFSQELHEEAKKYYKSYISKIDNASSIEDLIAICAESSKIGIFDLLGITFYAYGRSIYPMISPRFAVNLFELYYKSKLSELYVEYTEQTANDFENIVNKADLQSLEEGFSFDEYPTELIKINGVLKLLLEAYGINNYDKIIVAEKNVPILKKIDNLSAKDISDNLDTYKAMMKIGVLYSLYQHFEVYENEPKESYIKTVTDNNPYLKFNKYVENYADKAELHEIKEKTVNIIEEIKTIMKTKIENLDWMSPYTKNYAKKKLDDMYVYAVYPDSWNEDWCTFYPAGKSPSNIFEIYTLSNEEKYNKFCSALGSFENDLESSWYIRMQDYFALNAFNDPEVNSIFILYKFAKTYTNMSDAALYGCLGFIIGHELIHNFDDIGSTYDSKGYKSMWWANADLVNFTHKKEEIKTYYETFTYDGKMKFLDGTKTLGENIADLGGISAAYGAFVKKQEQNGLYGDELKIAKKNFFICNATTLATRIPPEFLDFYQQEDDTHSPATVRVNAVLPQMDDWYTLFNVTDANKLYISPDKRIRIW